MFTNDSGAAGGPVAYVQDAFQDISDPPTNNTGFSSTLSSNPLNLLYANDDFPRYGPKTLWIKDLILVQDRALWINGKPTYQCVWDEPFPSAAGYVFGNFQLVRRADQTFVTVKSVGDGFGVGGVFARCMFLMVGNTAAVGSATGTVSVDGTNNSTSVDWGNLAAANPANTPMYAATVHAAANEAYNIHDFRMVANQAGVVFTLAGVVVYSENTSLNIDQFPGTTYNNKTQSRTSVGVTIPLPSFGSSLGGKSTIWKTAASGYSMSTLGVSTIASIATGTNGTNILNLTAGTGASYAAGNGIITASSSGASPYVGVIQSISTDALTVFPTLPFGISNSIYRYFQAGQSLAMNASLNALAFTFGSTEMLRTGFTSLYYLDPLQNFAVWGQGIGMSNIDSATGVNPCLTFPATPTGFFQAEGYFSAVDVEWYGMSWGILSGTMCVNGLPVYNHNNIGFTGTLKKTVFLEAGPGWNTFAFFAGSSHINAGVSRINFYQRSRDISASYGILASFDTLQAAVSRADNATIIPPGVFKRTYADQINFGASFLRGIGGTHAGGIGYNSNTGGASFVFQYYGTHFAVIGGSFNAIAGGSLNILVDGVSTYGFTHLNQMIQCSSLTFHKLQVNILGGTNYISAIDFWRPTGEMKNLQIFSSTNQNPFTTVQPKPPVPSVYARYVSSSPTTLVSGAQKIIDFSVRMHDTHGCVVTGASWRFICKEPGLYSVRATVATDTATAVDNALILYKNGVGYATMDERATRWDYAFGAPPTLVKLNTNDFISVYGLQNSGGNIDISTSSTATYIEILRVGD